MCTAVAYGRVRIANGSRYTYIPAAAYMHRIFIESIYSTPIILLYVRLLRYIYRALGGLPFFSHSHVTDRLLPAKAARCIGTSYTQCVITPGTPPPPPPVDAQFSRSFSARLVDHRSPRLQLSLLPPITTRRRVDQRRRVL